MSRKTVTEEPVSSDSRRRFLKVAGGTMSVAGLAGLSGCTGGGDGGDGGGDGGDGGGDGGDGGGATPTSTPSLEEKAKSEGTVKVFEPSGNMEGLYDRFQDEFGIEVKTTGLDSGPLASRVLQQASSGNITTDFIRMGSISVLVNLLEEDVFTDLSQTPLQESNPKKIRAEGMLGWTFLEKGMGLGYNADMVSNPPSSVDEVVSGEYELTIDPTDPEVMLGLEMLNGKEKAEEICRKYGENGVVFTSHQSAAKAISSGEYPMGEVYYYHTLLDWAGPLTMLDLPKWPINAGIEYCGLLKDRPNPNASILFTRYIFDNALDFLGEQLSPDVFYTLEEAKSIDRVWLNTIERQVDWEKQQKRWERLTGTTPQ